jgi:hypothetical protein
MATQAIVVHVVAKNKKNRQKEIEPLATVGNALQDYKPGCVNQFALTLYKNSLCPLTLGSFNVRHYHTLAPPRSWCRMWSYAINIHRRNEERCLR